MVRGFYSEFEAIAQERTIVPDTAKQPRNGQTWGPKFQTVEAVLTEYRKRHGEDAERGPEPPPIDLDALTAALPLTEMF